MEKGFENISNSGVHHHPWYDSVTSTGELFYIEPYSVSFQEHASPYSEEETICSNGHTENSLDPDKSCNELKLKKPAKRQYSLSFFKNAISPKVRNHKGPDIGPYVNGNAMTSEESMLEPISREVNLDINREDLNIDDRTFERLFGIIPGNFQLSSKENEESLGNDRVKVCGLIPGGKAALSESVKIGAWLQTINNTVVTMENLHSVVTDLTTQKVILGLLDPVNMSKSKSKKNHVKRKSSKAGDRLIRIINNQSGCLSPPSSSQEHIVMYLSLLGLNADTMVEREEVKYHYPKQNGKLMAVRGLFITLCPLLREATDSRAHITTLVIEDRVINVAYHLDGSNILMMAVPEHSLSESLLCEKLNDVVRLLRVTYKSLDNAFLSQDNISSLDHFFYLIFECLLLQKDENENNSPEKSVPSSNLATSLSSVQYQPLPEEITVNISNTLSDLESADFADMSDGFYGCRRSYTILGACLFHKGSLLCNHLPAEDLTDVHLYLRYHLLLTLSTGHRIGQLIVWKEVHPMRRCHAVDEDHVFGYSEPDSRWFLLIIGIGFSLLCVMLEAGGCCAKIEGNPGPDPFYIDQVRATLMQIESQDGYDTRLKSSLDKHLLSADAMFPSKSRRDEHNTSPYRSKVQRSPSAAAVLGYKKSSENYTIKRTLSDQPHSTLVSPRDVGVLVERSNNDLDDLTGSRGRKESQDSDGSSDTGNGISLFKGQRKTRLFPSYSDNGYGQRLNGNSIEEKPEKRAVIGNRGGMFHYLQLNDLDGVYIAPTTTDAGPIHQQLVQNFCRSCLIIRKAFQISRKEQKSHNCDERDFVQEQGVMFQCKGENWSEKKQAPVLCYWVVGRRAAKSEDQELFVCFQESTPQNIVEMAFKIGFGRS